MITKWNKFREGPGVAVAHVHNQITDGLFYIAFTHLHYHDPNLKIIALIV
jgi:hypothetical protein